MSQLSSPTPDATTLTKGKVQLAGNLGGTAASPTVIGAQTNAISAAALATTAITIGFASVTASQTGITAASATQVTGLTATVTIPAGSRRIEIEACLPQVQITAGAAASTFISLWDGTVGSGTQLQEYAFTSAGNTYLGGLTVKAYPTPAAGSKTYNVGVRVNNSATSSLTMSAQVPGILIVKVI